MSALDLLPCPHCGGHAELIRPASGANPYVMCVDGYCTAPKSDEAEAIAAWNRRTPEHGKDGNNG